MTLPSLVSVLPQCFPAVLSINANLPSISLPWVPEYPAVISVSSCPYRWWGTAGGAASRASCCSEACGTGRRCCWPPPTAPCVSTRVRAALCCAAQELPARETQNALTNSGHDNAARPHLCLTGMPRVSLAGIGERSVVKIVNGTFVLARAPSIAAASLRARARACVRVRVRVGRRQGRGEGQARARVRPRMQVRG